MFSTFLFSAGTSIFKVSVNGKSNEIEEIELGYEIRCLAVDPHKKGRLYAGSFNNGLFISDDFGHSWFAVSDISHQRVLSIAVSETEVNNGYGVVWVGTEPSGLFRSEDGGRTWTERKSLLDIPSKPTWSFPPRPHTHHVRSIQPDVHKPERIFVGIELGGVMKSEDKGLTWEDRKEGSQFDCHTLTMSKLASDRVYEAAGGGYAETKDGGKTWLTINDGLSPYSYLVSIAVDSGDPDTIIASAAKNAHTAYMPERAHSVIVRKVKDEPWTVVQKGLPEPNHSAVFLLLSDPMKANMFWAANNTGIYQSDDAGESWNQLVIDWPERLLSERTFSFVAW